MTHPLVLSKRLKDRKSREVTTRRQVGDAEAVVNAPEGSNSSSSDDRQL